jgi:AcrR family transcriptional regulator
VGRPRASGAATRARSPRDEIVAVATRLFADLGFVQTTMSEIARA